MADTKYGHFLIHNPFETASEKHGGATMFRHNNADNSGVLFEHHYITDSKWVFDETRIPDTHELFIFAGGNPENILDMGAEIHMTLGKDEEEQIITKPTVVNVPPGLQHGPITLKNFKKPVNLLRIINSKEYQAKLDAEKGEDDFKLKRMKEGNDVTKNGKRYWMNTMSGPLYLDYEPGWTGTSFWAHHDEFSAGISLGYHCIVTPYDVRMSHGHTFHENLCFLSGDPNNPEELGADVKISFGKELEEYTYNVPTIMSMPPGTNHCPLLVHNVKKPVIFLEVSATRMFEGKPEDV